MVDKILANIANQIAIRPHYDNFIGGKWVPAVKGQTIREYFANRRSYGLHDCPLDRGRC